MSLKKNTKRNSSVKIGDPGYPKHSWMNCSTLLKIRCSDSTPKVSNINIGVSTPKRCYLSTPFLTIK